MMALGGPTHRAARTSTTTDYFVVSECLQTRLRKIEVLSDFLLRPHSPVRLTCSAGSLEWIPVLEMAPRFPTLLPFGPRREPHSCGQLGNFVGGRTST